jgi:hypothetical protein
MYNKPITQRVAFARGKKPSALKQTPPEDTTVLNEDIMAKLTTTETIPGQETTQIIETGPSKKYKGPLATGEKAKEWAKQKEYCKGKPKGTPGCAGFHEYEGGGTEKITTKDPDQTIKEEVPLYGYDTGDVDYTWQQRSRGRQALEGSRKSGKLGRKGYEGMTDEKRASSLGLTLEEYNEKGIKNKRQFGRAKKEYEAAQASESYDAYLQSQREASEQGIKQGSTGRAKVTVPDRNKYLNQLNKADTETMSTAAQTQAFYQNKKNENDANTANAAKNTADSQDAVDKTNAQTSTQKTDVVSITPKPTGNEEDPAVKMRNFGPLKMKSSFKMGGYGSKTYKK